MSEHILVTGAGGNTGALLVNDLLERGCKVSAAVRRIPEKSAEENLDYRLFDFTDRTSWDACLKGVDKVFLMRPPQMSKIKRDLLPFLKFLKDTGIKQLLFMSVQGAENNKMVPHYKVEQYCISLDLPYTFIRPSFFMQNLTTTHLSEIRNEKRVYVPAGEGKTNFIDVRDIAEIAAVLLTEEGHLGKGYTITGEKSYSHREIAAQLSAGLDEQITFTSPSPIRFIIHHLRRDTGFSMALLMVTIYSIVRFGKGDVSTETSEKILARKTRSLEEFIQDHKEILKGKRN